MAARTTTASPPIDTDLYKAMCDPISHTTLTPYSNVGLVNEKGEIYKFIGSNPRVIDFVEPVPGKDRDDDNLRMYDSSGSIEMYRNFLSWLFETFHENETTFRRRLIERLNLANGMKVLVTGCGLGDDLPLIVERIGPAGEIHAQDLSRSMIVAASRTHQQCNMCFSVSNAIALPYVSRFFDAVLHFGGINLFGDIKKAIAEMERVCRIGGRVVFGDEGIAPHLRGTQYAEIAITNNRLWAAEAPMHRLPHNAVDIELTYVLGNCFYVIAFTPSEGYPCMDIDIEHKGTRGGTARTRYFGQLEGVTQKTKDKLFKKAKERGISIHSFLEEIINRHLLE